MAALHLKAAAWFDDQGYAGEAVDHALRSGDMQQAKELILKHWTRFFHRGEVATVLRWLDALPEEGGAGTIHPCPWQGAGRSFSAGRRRPSRRTWSGRDEAYERLVTEGTLRARRRAWLLHNWR